MQQTAWPRICPSRWKLIPRSLSSKLPGTQNALFYSLRFRLLYFSYSSCPKNNRKSTNQYPSKTQNLCGGKWQDLLSATVGPPVIWKRLALQPPVLLCPSPGPWPHLPAWPFASSTLRYPTAHAGLVPGGSLSPAPYCLPITQLLLSVTQMYVIFLDKMLLHTHQTTV